MSCAEFPKDLRSAHAARRFVRRQTAGYPEHLVEASVLLVSELVTNAVVHARSASQVDVRPLGCGGVHIEVSDACPLPPRVQLPSETASSGRGVSLMEAVSSRWGFRSRPNGKTIWFDVEAPR